MEQVVALPPADAAIAAPVTDDVITTALTALVLVESEGARATGFFSASDLVTTTATVIAHGKTASVTLPDGRRLDATIVASADSPRLARLRVNTSASTWLPVSPTRDYRSGEAVARLSWPQMSARGVLKAMRRDNGVSVLDAGLQVHTDDDGDPVIDRTGRVLGVVAGGRTVSFDGAQPYFR